MFPGGSLATRLLTGLLLITGLGLLVTGIVSFLTLRAFITDRIDDEVEFTARSAMARLEVGNPPIGQEAPSPTRYFVVQLDPETAEVLHYWGDAPRDDVVIERLDQYSVEELRSFGITQEIFELDGVVDTVPPQRATVRLDPDGIVVSGVPTDEREIYPLNLVSAQLITAGILLLVLVLTGRWLMVRGLAPLDRMATKANEIGSGSDLRARMPDAGPRSEVGRLGLAINTMLARLEDAFERQQASEARIRAFAADASHELRTPLTTIRGYAELYRQGAISQADLPGAIARIEDEAGRMSRLVAELLELARLDRGGELAVVTSDIAAITREMAADAATLEPDRPVSVDAPQQLLWDVDESRFRQILANLLANIREHTPPEAAVTVRLSCEENTWVRLEVHDAGPGMTAEDKHRAFDRFYRGHRAPGGGSGLGLSIVPAIAAAHDGEVSIDSTPGHGTTVTVRFPRPMAGPEPGTDPDHGSVQDSEQGPEQGSERDSKQDGRNET
jgi:two-component system, OmpR family, sensor kinase